MGKTKETFLVDQKDNSDVRLLGTEVMRSRKESVNRKTKQGEIRSEYSINELKRFARMTIDDRMKFCQEYKKEEPFDKCVCEAIERYIRLFKDSPMKGDKHLTKLRLEAIQKLFDEMKKEGKIKCPGNIEKNEKNENENQPKQPT